MEISRGILNEEFVLGFLYGGMFLLKQLPKEPEPYFITYNTTDNGRYVGGYSSTYELIDLYTHGNTSWCRI